MFIKLHENNNCEYINFDTVTNIHVSNGKTYIFTETSREYFEVKETPEEIMELIRNEQVGYNNDMIDIIQTALDNSRISISRM